MFKRISEVKILAGDEFRRMQLLQLDMLRELDRVCRKNGIKYSMMGGTFIGAIRDKGYIPWDDDADIGMLREEYEKFKSVADQLDPQICYFQDNDTDPEYRWGYGKLRRTGTTYIRVGQEHLKCKTGFFIDIFPLDDVPNTIIGMKLQNAYCYCLRKTLWSEVGKLSAESFLKRRWFSLLSHIKPETVFCLINRMAKKSKNDKPNRVRILMFTPVGMVYLNKTHPLKLRYGMPKEWFLNLTDYNFENIKLLGSVDYDAHLKYEFGDYMKLPPENEREPHAPVSYYDFGELL